MSMTHPLLFVSELFQSSEMVADTDGTRRDAQTAESTVPPTITIIDQRGCSCLQSGTMLVMPVTGEADPVVELPSSA